MITIKLSLDKRRIKNNGTYPLVFKISSKGNSRDLPTGYSIKETYWNSRTQSIKEAELNYSVIFPKLKELELSYRKKIVEFEKINHAEDIQEVREYILGVNNQSFEKNATVIQYWQNEIKSLIETKRIGNAKASENSLNAIIKIKDLDISFEAVNHRLEIPRK
ncbi:MAG: hypothetical protein H0W73_15575 [Bacteroidetes bacterium]|nr:hypothetical protein [Bacteroidota bacterium]